MRRARKIILGLFVFAMFLILFRGQLYRSMIKYKAIRERPHIELESPEVFHDKISGSGFTTSEVIDLALSETSRRLSFSRHAQSNDPNELLKIGNANCVGYSAVFNSVLHELISRNGNEESIHAQHLVGRLELLGIDLHQFARSSFLQDHDFNRIEDRERGMVYYVDPTIGDILRITRVTAK